MLERLHQAKLNGSGKLERFVLEIDREDDGTLLKKFSITGRTRRRVRWMTGIRAFAVS